MPNLTQGKVMRNSKILFVLYFILVSHTCICTKLDFPYLDYPEENIDVPYYALDGCQIYYYCKRQFVKDFQYQGIPTEYLQLYSYSITKIPDRDFIMYFFLIESERKFCLYYVKCLLNEEKMTVVPYPYSVAKHVFPDVFTKEQYVKISK